MSDPLALVPWFFAGVSLPAPAGVRQRNNHEWGRGSRKRCRGRRRRVGSISRRQLLLGLAAATIVARRAISTRQHAVEQAHRESEQATRAKTARSTTNARSLAAARLQPVFDSGWWRQPRHKMSPTCGLRPPAGKTRPPRDIAEIFDHAASRIRHCVCVATPAWDGRHRSVRRAPAFAGDAELMSLTAAREHQQHSRPGLAPLSLPDGK